jgi:hypothetical protein
MQYADAAHSPNQLKRRSRFVTMMGVKQTKGENGVSEEGASKKSKPQICKANLMLEQSTLCEYVLLWTAGRNHNIGGKTLHTFIMPFLQIV